MKKLILHFFILIPIAVLAACAANSNTTAASGTHTAVENKLSWHIEFSVSGGFAGISRQLIMDQDGSLLISDRKLGQYEGKLTSTQLAEVNRLLGALTDNALQKESLSKAGRCADCILSRLSIDMNDKHYGAEYKSGESAPLPYQDLFTFLSTHMQQALNK